MNPLKKFLDRIKPNFEEGGKLQAFRSVYDGFETFLFTPNTTAKPSGGVQIHDSMDSKRTMIIVVLALMPCFFFGMYNTGYQHWLACGETVFPFWSLMLYGFLAILPKVVVSYVVGLGIEFVSAQLKHEEIQEGFLVTGILVTMIIVVLALMPCFFFGMYNTGYQHWMACGETVFPFWSLMFYGFLAILPKVVVSYVVGLGIEFVSAQLKHEEIQEGFLVTGILVPMIIPVETPLWMLAVAVAFAVIFAKEVFGGTGYNIFNVALVTRAFLFFAYPAKMSGDNVFVATGKMFGFGPQAPDGFSCATPLGQIATTTGDSLSLTGIDGSALTWWDAFVGLIPGSFGETSVICILIGAAILLLSGIGGWRIMLSALVGGIAMGALAHACATPTYPASYLTCWDQLLYGGFMFAIVFMATDPVTAARTNTGKYIYGFMIGVIAVLIRTYNNGYPEGAMLAVLLMNAFAPLIDYCVVQSNIRRRMKRVTAKNA